MWHAQPMMPGPQQPMYGGGNIHPYFYQQQVDVNQQIGAYLTEISAWRDTCFQKDVEMKSLKAKLLTVTANNEGLHHRRAQQKRLKEGSAEEGHQKELQDAEDRIGDLEATIQNEREEYKNFKVSELKKNRTLVLTKVKDSLSQVDLLKKKLSRTERQKKDLQNLLEQSGNLLGEQHEEKQKMIKELRQEKNDIHGQLKEYRVLLADREDKMKIQEAELADINNKKCVLKKKLFKATKEIKEINATIVHDQKNFKEQQKVLDDLKSINKKLRQENEKLQKRHTKILRQKEVHLKQTFEKSYQEKLEGMKTTHKQSMLKKDEELANQTEALVHAETLLAQMTEKQTVSEGIINQLKTENQILRMAKADAETMNVKVLDEKEKELACIKKVHGNQLKQLSDSQAVLEEEKNQLDIENNILRLAKGASDSMHATQMTEKEEELLQIKTAQEKEEKLRINELDKVNKLNETLRKEMSEAKSQHCEREKEDKLRINKLAEVNKLNESLKKEMTEAKSQHQLVLSKKEIDLEESKHIINKLNKHEQEKEKKINTMSKKLINLEKNLNVREIQIRSKLEEILKLKKSQTSNEKTIQTLKDTAEKQQNKLAGERRRINSLIKERDAYKHEAQSKSLELIKKSRKLDSTKEYLQQVKDNMEELQSQKEHDEMAKTSKKKRRKRTKKTADVKKTKQEENAITVNQTNKKNEERNAKCTNSKTDECNITKENILATKPVPESSGQPTFRTEKPETPQIVDTDNKKETERSWSLYDTSLMAFCFTLWFAMANICTYVSNDDPFW
ncbi:interaptin-like [Clytia hemisphaerica]